MTDVLLKSNSIPVPIHPVISYPPFKCPSGLCCPVTAPLPSQQFNDPGGADSQPHHVDVDVSLLTKHLKDNVPKVKAASVSKSVLPPLPSTLDHQFALPPTMPLPPPLAPLSAHLPLVLSNSLPMSFPSPLVPLSVHLPSSYNLSPRPLPSSLAPLPAHSLLLPDLSPTPLPSPPAPLPACSPLPSNSSPTPLPSPPLLVHTALLPPPPGLLLAFPSWPLNSSLMSSCNGSCNIPLVLPACSSLPSHFQSPPTLPISSVLPHSPLPQPSDTTQHGKP